MQTDSRREARNLISAFLQTEKEAEAIQTKYTRQRQHIPEIHPNPHLEDDFDLAVKLLQEKQARPERRSQPTRVKGQQITELKQRRIKLERESVALQQEFKVMKQNIMQKENLQGKLNEMENRVDEAKRNYLNFKREKFCQKLGRLFHHRLSVYSKVLFSNICDSSLKQTKRERIVSRRLQLRKMKSIYSSWRSVIAVEAEQKQNSEYLQQRLRQVYQEHEIKKEAPVSREINDSFTNPWKKPKQEPITLRELEEDVVGRRQRLELESDLIQKVYEAVKQNLVQEFKYGKEAELTVYQIEQKAAEAQANYLQLQRKKLGGALQTLFESRREEHQRNFFNQLMVIAQSQLELELELEQRFRYARLQTIFTAWIQVTYSDDKTQQFKTPIAQTGSDQKNLQINSSLDTSLAAVNPWKQPRSSTASSTKNSKSIHQPKPAPARLKELEDKAQHRKQMNELVKKKHEEKRKQKEIEKQLQEQERQLQEQKQRQEEYEQYQLRKKMEKDQREQKILEQKMAIMNENLAKETYQRSLETKFFRTLQVFKSIRDSQMLLAERYHNYQSVKSAFHMCLDFHQLCMMEWEKEQEYKEQIAAQHHRKQRARYFLWALRQHHYEANINYHQSGQVRLQFLKRNVFVSWYQCQPELRIENIAIDKQQDQIVADFRQTKLMQSYFHAWFENSSEQRTERLKNEHKNKMWNKVNHWLVEFDQNKRA